MHTAGTSILERRFCRRASRSSAAGRKTDGEDGFLLSGSGMGSRYAFKHRAVMIRRHFDDPNKFKPAGFNGVDGLVWGHSQFGPRTARFSKDNSFLTRP